MRFKRSKKTEDQDKRSVLTDEQKIEEMKLRPDGRSIYSSRYLLGDHDERTKRSVRQFLLTSTAIVCVGAGMVWYGIGEHQYHQVVFNSTTPAGTALHFTNNQSQVKVIETWTDKAHNVSVVRLDFSNAMNSVSHTGKNYNINIAYLKDAPLPKGFQAKFGFLGTSSDAYLFLKGDLKNSPYRIILSSHRTINQQQDDRSNVQQYLAVNGDIDKALANNDNSDGSGFNLNLPNTHKKARLDAISFRINPYSTNTKVYNGSFLTSDGDIDYSKIIDVMSVKSNTKAIDEQIKADYDYINKAEVTIDEYNDRLRQNPNDSDSESQKKDLLHNIQEKKKEIAMLKQQKKSFNDRHFTQQNFGDMQTTFSSFPYTPSE